MTDPEPPTAGSSLYTLPNLFLTPHIAGSLNDERHRLADYMIDDFERWGKGEETLYAVNPQQLLTAK